MHDHDTTGIDDNYEGRNTFYNVFADNDHARCTIMIWLWTGFEKVFDYSRLKK